MGKTGGSAGGGLRAHKQGPGAMVKPQVFVTTTDTSSTSSWDQSEAQPDKQRRGELSCVTATACQLWLLEGRQWTIWRFIFRFTPAPE